MTYTANTHDTSLEVYFQKHTFIYENMPFLDIDFELYSSPETREEPGYCETEITSITIENVEQYTDEQIMLINTLCIDKEAEILSIFENDMIESYEPDDFDY